MAVSSRHPLVLSVDLQGQQRQRPAALQWSFFYPPGAVERVIVEPEDALKRAEKHLTCSSVKSRTTCIVAGTNTHGIPNGVMGRATFFLEHDSAASGLVIAVRDGMAASPEGNAMQLLCLPDRSANLRKQTTGLLKSLYATARHRVKMLYHQYWPSESR